MIIQRAIAVQSWSGGKSAGQAIGGWLLFLIVLAGVSEVAHGAKQRVWYLDLEGTPASTKLSAFAVQGIANRAGPRVLVRLGDDSRWERMRFDVASEKYGRLWDPSVVDEAARKYGRYHSDFWADWLADERGYSVQSIELLPLVKRVASELNGVVLYRDLSDISAAATLAGLKTAVPLKPAQYKRWQNAGVDLPVAADLRDAYPSQGSLLDRRLRAHRWAIDNLLPRVAKDGAVSRVKLYHKSAHDTITDVDQAIQQRWFVYDLNHRAQAHYPNREIDNPPDKPLLDQILSALDDWSPVFGWGRPGENDFIRALSRHKLINIGGGVPNGSFFRQLPPESKGWRQTLTHAQPADVTVDKKVYVTFMVNEGETLKAAYSQLIDGSWLQPERGQIPINWGISAYLVKHFPGLMEYYYKTRTKNDYFFSSGSGWGYTHIPWIPRDGWSQYASLVRDGIRYADTPYGDLWWIRQLEKEGVLGDWIDRCGFAGMTDWDNSMQAVKYTDSGKPILKTNYYYTLKKPAKFAKMLKDDYRNVELPWLVVVYGARLHGNPYRFHEVARRLPESTFEIVRLDEMAAIARKAREQLQGRVWKPGPDAPKGVAP
jgi:hypothetical protein